MSVFGSSCAMDLYVSVRLQLRYGSICQCSAPAALWIYMSVFGSSCAMDLYVSVRLQLRKRAIFLNTETNHRLPSSHGDSVALVSILTSTCRVGDDVFSLS